MSPRATNTERLLSLLGERGLIRARDLASVNIDRKILQRPRQQGLVECVERGVYRLPEIQKNSIAVACKLVPKGVVCLLSALSFHGLIKDQPPDIWIAIGSRERIPHPNGAAMKFVRFSGDALTQGVQNLKLDRVPNRVYSPIKSVADCLKFRNKIGIGVARSALRTSVAKRSYSRERLLHFAKVCRVKKLF